MRSGSTSSSSTGRGSSCKSTAAETDLSPPFDPLGGTRYIPRLSCRLGCGGTRRRLNGDRSNPDADLPPIAFHALGWASTAEPKDLVPPFDPIGCARYLVFHSNHAT